MFTSFENSGDVRGFFRHYTAIHFKNVPTKPDVDVDFQIKCSVPAKVGNFIFLKLLQYTPLPVNKSGFALYWWGG